MFCTKHGLIKKYLRLKAESESIKYSIESLRRNMPHAYVNYYDFRDDCEKVRVLTGKLKQLDANLSYIKYELASLFGLQIEEKDNEYVVSVISSCKE